MTGSPIGCNIPLGTTLINMSTTATVTAVPAALVVTVTFLACYPAIEKHSLAAKVHVCNSANASVWLKESVSGTVGVSASNSVIGSGPRVVPTVPGHYMNFVEIIPTPSSVNIPGLVAFIFGGSGVAEVASLAVPIVAGTFLLTVALVISAH